MMSIPVGLMEVFIALFTGVGTIFYLFFDAFLGTLMRSTL